MKISVIIPTYKPQSYLWECLDSLYNQTLSHEDFEVILVLNGCNEPFNKQINEWIETHPDMLLNFIQTNQGGVSNARNIALDVAQGEYVTFIDDDDYISSNYLKTMLDTTDGDSIVIARPYAFVDGNPDIEIYYPLSNLFNQLEYGVSYSPSKVWRYFSGPCMKLIPLSFIQGRRFDTSFSIGEDGLFMFLISDKFRRVKVSKPDSIYYRRYRQGSLLTSGRTCADARKNSLRLLKTMFSYYMSKFYRYNILYTSIHFASVIKSIIKPNIINRFK